MNQRDARARLSTQRFGPSTPFTQTGYQALQGAHIGQHQIGVPGRHEAEALTDCCPRVSCATPVKPAAVLDEVKRGRITGRYGAYRCPSCDAAWLCWWAPAIGRVTS
jgi:hypothetical protein